MKKLAPLAAIAALILASCGGTAPHTAAITGCVPAVGAGVAGVCAPHHPSTSFSLPSTARLVPDVSEFQGCALHSEAIVRVYEAGSNLEDTRAACHLAELRRLHAWSAAYFFARPPGFGNAPSCTAQADTAVRIARSLGVTGPVVDDAEVPLPSGFVSCVKKQIESDGYPAVEYTCPGCGEQHVGAVWIADYPIRPPGTWVAHQFSDDFDCRGIVTDCSVDEGITSILLAKAKPSRTLLGELLGSHTARNPHGHNCANPPYKHAYPNARYDHACLIWSQEVR